MREVTGDDAIEIVGPAKIYGFDGTNTAGVNVGVSFRRHWPGGSHDLIAQATMQPGHEHIVATDEIELIEQEWLWQVRTGDAIVVDQGTSITVVVDAPIVDTPQTLYVGVL